MSTSNIEWFLAFILAYIGAPVTLVGGWMRWTMQRPKIWTALSVLSFIGFALASASAALALLTIGVAMLGGFGEGNALFYHVLAVGFVLSLTGLLFAVGGVWRENTLRWFAPSCAIGTCAFWLVASTWP